LPRVLANVVVDHLRATRRRAKHVARAGEFESLLDTREPNACMEAACRGGHVLLALAMMQKGAKNWDAGLAQACRGGHANLVYMMIANGADDWDGAMKNACRAGHVNFVHFMIQRGANKWSSGLESACREAI
jgi:hypothetical protein